MSFEPFVPAGPTVPVVPRVEWEVSRASYLARVEQPANDRLHRTSRGQKHPVHDFLFEYYSFRPAHLLRWTPGFGVILEAAGPGDVQWSEFDACAEGLMLNPGRFPRHRVSYLQWAVEYLTATRTREPAFICVGMHEWAMVYRDRDVRHPQVPFRLSREETDAVVESQVLRCTHYDAFRFFTPAATPRNRWELTRATTSENDQPGCLHVNMDLYRFAYKIAPYCPSTVVADAFEVALAAREIDMRASPYDLTAFGYEPVKVETAAGRAEYIELQREIYRRAVPVRVALLEVYSRLLAAVV